eukprot:gene13616-biopygen14008
MYVHGRRSSERFGVRHLVYWYEGGWIYHRYSDLEWRGLLHRTPPAYIHPHSALTLHSMPAHVQNVVRRAATDSSLQQTENTFLAMKDTIEAAYAANLASLKEKLKNRPDAPICTKCKKPVDRYHALRMICVPRVMMKGQRSGPLAEPPVR